jgi:hypothetical protein
VRELSVGSGPRLPDAISRKRLIGGLLIKEGLITRPALEEALGAQARMEGYRPIGQILVERRLVTRKQLDFVLERYRKKRRLGDVLVEAKALTEAQLTAALTHQRGTDRRLGEVLVGLGLVGERRVREALSAQLGIAFVDLDEMGLDPRLAGLVSEGYARRHRVVPVRRTEDRITVVMEDPADLETLEDLRASLGSRIEVVTTTRGAFDRTLGRIYGHAGADPEPTAEPRPEPRLQPGGDAAPAAPDGLVRQGQEDERARDALAADPEAGRGAGAGGGDIMEVNAGDLRTVVDAARRMVADWDRFVASVEALTKEDEERRAALARLEASQRELRQENESLRDARDHLSRELQAASQGLAELRVAHESLVREHNAASAELREVRERHDTLQRDRQFAADQLESVLSRIKF